MAIVDTTKLDAALASKDKDAIRAALSTLSTRELSKDEKSAIYVSLFEASLDATNSFNAIYKNFLKEKIAQLEKLDGAIGKAEDKEQIEQIKKSI